MKFKSKIVEIEAMQFDGKNYPEILVWADKNNTSIMLEDDLAGDMKLLIPTLEGTMEASPGDFIIKGLKGEFYPCKPDIFAMKYEEIKPPEPGCPHCPCLYPPDPRDGRCGMCGAKP